jgi:aspartyl-tRNA(Asn)/glutamyl-tRNA(Gln) amidotransferase subunit C
MPRISAEEVEHIASLARLELGAEEVTAMARDMDRVLGYVATLDELDTSGIEPTAHAIALQTPVRLDEAVPGMDPELAVEGAPQSAGTAFVVPKVLDEEES